MSASLPSNEPGAENRRSTRYPRRADHGQKYGCARAAVRGIHVNRDGELQWLQVRVEALRPEGSQAHRRNRSASARNGLRDISRASGLGPAAAHLPGDFPYRSGIRNSRKCVGHQIPAEGLVSVSSDEELVVPVYLEGDEPETFAVPAAGGSRMNQEQRLTCTRLPRYFDRRGTGDRAIQRLGNCDSSCIFARKNVGA